MRSGLIWVGAIALVIVGTGNAGAQTAADRLARSVDELRHAVGWWSTTTEFLNADGTIAGTVRGTYEFEWVVPDRVVRGRSDIPELKQSAAILFYVSDTLDRIEMASVGADGRLWTMTGSLGSDTRQTPAVTLQDGSSLRLRFTRSNVSPDRVESRMERSTNGGKTWVAGNHQVFERQAR